MARANYSHVLDHVYKFEGGYVDHPRDPGGATNMGITIGTLSSYLGRRATKAEVRNLSREIADEIYRKNYWDVVKGDALPYGLDLVAMDGAVNSGPRRGARWLQKGIGSKADGVVGPKTIEAAQKAPVGAIPRACEARMSFLRGLRHWSTFRRGWSRRVASVEAHGVKMYLRASEGDRVAREALREQAKAAPKKAVKAAQAGKAQAASLVTAGGGAGWATAAEMPTATTTAGALLVGVVAALLVWRSNRRAKYQQDRESAYAVEAETIHIKGE